MEAVALQTASNMARACVSLVGGSSLLLLNVIREQKINDEVSELTFKLMDGPKSSSLTCRFNESTLTAEVTFTHGMFDQLRARKQCSIVDGNIQIEEIL